VLPRRARCHGLKPGGDGLAFLGSPGGGDEVGRQAGHAEHQQDYERQYHVHTHQVPVDCEQETHIVR
jgi:hypothetical protein